MSTLTSHSPSPAASPRSAFHIRDPRAYSAASPRPIPRPTSSATSSPKPLRPAFNAPSAPSRPSRDVFVESGPVVEAGVRGETRAFVAAGTQYSPDGSPPTSRRRHNLASLTTRLPESTGGLARKRKDAARSRSPPPQDPMSSATAGPPPGSASLPTSPSEPEPRVNPTETGPSHQPDTSTNPPHAASRQAPTPEPQEARSTHGHSSAPKRSRPESGSIKIMPLRYETCNPKDLGVLISSMLMELLRLNDQIPLRDGRLTRFHSRAPPGISVSDYLQRLIQHATLSPPIMLSMVYYIDRLCALYSAFTINSLTVHRFLITAATVAAKGLSDSFWTNPTYARIGGIPVSELATLELEFLMRVQWKIVPRPELLEEYYGSLVERTEGYELEGGASRSGSASESVGSSDEAESVNMTKDDDVDVKMANEQPT